MKTREIKLCEITTEVLFIGFEGEQNYRRFVIDASEIFAEMPDAVPSMSIKPPVGNVYPKAVQRDGNTVVWVASASDCAHEGNGEYQLTFTNGNEIGKVFKGQFRVFDSLVGSGSAPDPVDDWAEDANALLGEFRDMTATASGLPSGSEPTAEMTDVGGHKNISFGIPAGEQGEQGDPGQDGVSPSVSVTEITGGHRVTIVDAAGTKTFDVMDGDKGDPGQPGVSPSVTVTEITNGHRVAITDATGTETFDVMNGDKGDPGDPTELIDDNSTATNRTWSAQKLNEIDSTTKSAINAKQDAPSSGEAAGKVLGLALVDGQLVPVWDGFPVSDVQVNGTSILSQGVANIPVAGENTIGAVKVAYGYQGLYVHSTTNQLIVSKASDSDIKTGTNQMKPIVPDNQDKSVFYALAKLAGADMKNLSGETVGVYPSAQLVAIQKMLGLWTPKFYVRTTPLAEDSANISGTDFGFSDAEINIWEELVITLYQTGAGQEWASNDWCFAQIRDVVNNGYINVTDLYLKGSAPAMIRIKRLPSVLFIETFGNNGTNTRTFPRDANYIDKIRWIQIGCNNGTIKSGACAEAYIGRFY